MPVINGTPGDDTLAGTSGDDEIHGGAGNDTLTDNFGGNDQLYGEGDNDTLLAIRTGALAAATILLDGGSGNDSLTFDGNGVADFVITVQGNAVTGTDFYFGP